MRTAFAAGVAGGRAAYQSSVASTLEYFPALGKRMNVAAGSLSGGEQQMLAIASAPLQRPKVLLIDELSMGLAPVIVESILPTLRNVASTDRTAIVLVEQHVRLALTVADRAVVLAHGSIALQDDAAALAADHDVADHRDRHRRVVACVDGCEQLGIPIAMIATPIIWIRTRSRNNQSSVSKAEGEPRKTEPRPDRGERHEDVPDDRRPVVAVDQVVGELGRSH